jgi:hypothetical protein
MENKKAKITKLTFTKEWGNGNNVTYYHDIELDNGDKGSIGSKEKLPTKLNPGNELTYTIESGQYGNRIKDAGAQNSGAGFSGGVKKSDPKLQHAAFAMSYTKDLVVADKIKISEMSQYFEKIHAAMATKL